MLNAIAVDIGNINCIHVKEQKSHHKICTHNYHKQSRSFPL